MEPSRGKSICVPFASEDHSTACVAEPECVRQHLGARHREPPARLPERFAEGFRFHDQRWSIKQPLWTRRIELTATGQLLQRRPSCLLPSMVARTDEGEKALDLRHWGVPCAALCDVCGRSPMVWSRAEVALGRPSIVGSTVKQPQRRPEDLLADEKPTWAFGHTGLGANHGGRRRPPRCRRGRSGLGRSSGGRVWSVCPRGPHALACRPPSDGVH